MANELLVLYNFSITAGSFQVDEDVGSAAEWIFCSFLFHQCCDGQFPPSPAVHSHQSGGCSCSKVL